MTVMDFLAGRLGASGTWNCSTLVADWLIARGYPDFAEPYRALTDVEGCAAVAAEHGGLADLWDDLFLCRVPPADAPWQPGDIAVVAIGPYEAGAIYTGERWALRGARGLIFAVSDQIRVTRGWRP